ncbi:MAG: GRP family sugar transporter [Acidobacteriota bacterium]|jgi:glucose uptake protein GlcU|nr:GRP family sugar transporter [Acidobacteriota bacterium]
MGSGVIFAVIVSVLFAVYAVPRKFSKQNAVLYTMWVGVAYLAGSVAICSVVWGFGLREQENLFSRWHFLTALRGVVWVCGIASFNIAIDKIGLTRFNQWKNFQGPIGTILMLAFLSEVVGSKVIWLLLGMTMMFISAVLFTIVDREALINKRSNIGGILFALLAAASFGVTAFINKIITNQGFIYSQLLYHSLSVVISAAIIFIIQTRKPEEVLRVSRKTWLPVMSGAMYLAATILSMFSYTMIAGGVSWSITQLNAVWTILIGIFIFREVSLQKHWPRIIAGFVFALAAIVFLLFAL